jgi:phenylpyruvate tautomerase PptA (4-oxalocrotonate tautomerase family)
LLIRSRCAKAITYAAEILKAKLEHVAITYDEGLNENWYISGEQSGEQA